MKELSAVWNWDTSSTLALKRSKVTMTGENYTKTAFGTPGIRREDIEGEKAVVGRRNQRQRGSIVVNKEDEEWESCRLP